MADTDSQNDITRQAGRGFLFITGAKLYFLLTATFASLAFPRLFGDPVLFGRYRVVSGLLNVVTMVVITATVQAVSKLSSESGASLRSVRRSAVLVQTFLFGPIFGAMFLFAEDISGFLLRDPGLGTPLRVASLVVLAYAYYAVLVGTLNGTRRFGRQAALDVTYSTMKTAFMVALVVATSSVTWAFGGFAAAAFLVLGVALFVASLDPEATAGEPVKKRYLSFLLPLGGYALVLNLLLQADIIGIKASLGGGLDAWWSNPALADEASLAAGIYGAAKNVATIPYQAVISLTFVVFPFVSRATSVQDKGSADATVAGAMRLASVLSGLSVAVLGTAGGGLLTLLFGEAYTGGGAVLVPLLTGVSLMALMFVGNAILASAGRPLVSLLCGGVAVAVQAGLLFLLLSDAGDSARAWNAAALSTVAGCGCGALTSLVFLRRVFPGAVWVRTAVTAALALGVVIGLDHVAGDAISWPLRSLAAAVVFTAVLVAGRAVGKEDIRSVLSILHRSR